MTANSQRNGNLHLDRLVQDRIGASARRWEQEIEKELKRLSGNTTKFVGDAQSSIFSATEQSLNRISGSLDRIEKRVRSTESNLVRRWLLPSVLSALLILAAQQASWNLQALHHLIWPQALLGQAGMELRKEDGRQWITVPPSVKVQAGSDGWRFIRMAED